jgi:hypothetical protein
VGRPRRLPRAATHRPRCLLPDPPRGRPEHLRGRLFYCFPELYEHPDRGRRDRSTEFIDARVIPGGMVADGRLPNAVDEALRSMSRGPSRLIGRDVSTRDTARRVHWCHLITALITCSLLGSTANAERRLTLKCDGTWVHMDFEPYKYGEEHVTKYYTLHVKTEKETRDAGLVVTKRGMGFDYGRWYDWDDGEWYEFSESPTERVYWLR